MCGTFSRSPEGVTIASFPKRTTPPAAAARQGVGPSSLVSNSICRPRQIPEERPARATSITTSVRPLASSSRDAVGHRALPGQHDPLGVADDGGVDGHDDIALRRDMTQRFGDRVEVAHSVVDDDDCHQAIDQESDSGAHGAAAQPSAASG